MSVTAINSIFNNINKNTNTSDNTPKNTVNSTEQKKNGNMLLLGSLAALALGGGIYLATRGRNSKAMQTAANETANNARNLIKRKVNPELIEDTELRNIIKDIDTEIKDFSTHTYFYIYINKLKGNLYKKLLGRFINYKSPSELREAVEELSAKKYNIPEKAVGELANNIDFKLLTEGINGDRVKIAFEENSTQQKKAATILSACAERSRIRLLDLINNSAGIFPHKSLTQAEKNNLIEKSYEEIIKELKISFDFLNS